MTTFTYKEKDFYIDDQLANQLVRKVFPELQKRDKDVVFIVDGKERSGKSKFGDILCAFAAKNMDKEYDLSNVCLTPEEFRTRIQNSTKNDIVLYDEAHRGMGSRRALSEINNILIDLMMEMGQKNLFVVIIMPTFFMLDRYPALFRAKGLFHIYEKKGQRGFWCYFNEKKKLDLYIKGKKLLNYNCMRWPKFRGRFYNQYSIDEEGYRSKKVSAFNDKPRITKAETFMEQRNKALFAIHNELGQISAPKLRNVIKKYGLVLKDTALKDIIRDYSGKLGEIGIGIE